MAKDSKLPHTPDNEISYINIEYGFALFGDDIIVPVCIDNTDKRETDDFDLIKVGPCEHIYNNEFFVPSNMITNPTFH